MVDIAVISGSKSDQAIVDKIVRKLEEEEASFEHRVLSAHRNPKELNEFVTATDARVFIAVAGLDALLSIVQMPPGVPVACVGIDNGENAALLALRILESGR